MQATVCAVPALNVPHTVALAEKDVPGDNKLKGDSGNNKCLNAFSELRRIGATCMQSTQCLVRKHSSILNMNDLPISSKFYLQC